MCFRSSGDDRSPRPGLCLVGRIRCRADLSSKTRRPSDTDPNDGALVVVHLRIERGTCPRSRRSAGAVTGPRAPASALACALRPGVTTIALLHSRERSRQRACHRDSPFAQAGVSHARLLVPAGSSYVTTSPHLFAERWSADARISRLPDYLFSRWQTVRWSTVI
jgi:hypothetical protein